MPKMLKIIQKWSKMPKIAQKMQQQKWNRVKNKQNLAQLWKFSTRGAATTAIFFHLCEVEDYMYIR